MSGRIAPPRERLRRSAVHRVVIAAALMIVAGVPAASAEVDPGLEEAQQSSDPCLKVHYASIAFYTALQLFAQKPAADAAMTVPREQAIAQFHSIEALLLQALQLTEQADASAARLARSQAAFLLGDIYAHAFHDAAKAKQHYEIALQAVPWHAGAAQALLRLAMARENAP